MLLVIKKFIEKFGEKKTLQLVSEYIDELAIEQIKNSDEENQIENFSHFKLVLLSSLTTGFMKNNTSFKIIEDTKNKLELRFTKCLWAKVFNQLGFDGYRGCKTACRAHYSIARALHPNVNLRQMKTLMQGHKYCELCYTWQE